MGETAVADQKSEEIREHQQDDKDKAKTTNGLPEKVFVERESLLTELYKDKNIRSIYNFFLAILFGLIISTVLNDIFDLNGGRSSISLVVRSFAKLDLVLLVWGSEIISTFVVFEIFNFWAKVRCGLTPKTFLQKAWDKFWILTIVHYYFLVYYILAKTCIDLKVPTASAAFLLIDGTRILMKVHAFIRSCAPEVLSYKPHTETPIPRKRFSRFLFFLFAPTLIYRDDYPRNKHIRWWYVAQCAVEVFGEIYFCSIVLNHILIPSFEDFGRRKYTWTEVALKMFANVPAGMLGALLLFYCVLHSWQNGFAELLRFGDRMFYKDWWTSTTYPRYYRTWNVVVHEWLFEYIYKDVRKYVWDNKGFATFLVALISALVHEYVLIFSLGLFCPFLFVSFFGVGGLLRNLRVPRNNFWNIMFLYSFFLGFAMLMNVYAMEIYARTNLPADNHTVLEFMIPKIFSSGCFY